MTRRKSSRDIDVSALKDRLLAQAETLVMGWLPSGKKAGEYVKFGGLDGSAGNSAWVHLGTGHWRDEAAPEDSGGDLISLYAALRCSGDNARALLDLAEEFGMLNPTEPKGARVPTPAAPEPVAKAMPSEAKPAPDWRPLHPVPADAPDYRTQWGHFARGRPTAHWEYRDQAGALLGVVCRFDATDGTKAVEPLSYCEGERGQRMWRYRAFVQPRPLYGLDRLPEVDSTTLQEVVIVEGEKCADALQSVLGRPVLAWPGGANAVAKADWSPLRGFRVLCWPDADAKTDKESGAILPRERQPGMAAMRAVEKACKALGCVVTIVDVGAPGDRPDGWDCADAIAAGWGVHELQQLMGQHLFDAPSPAPAPAPRRPVKATGSGHDVTESWRDRLIWSRGAIRECVPNIIELMTNHPEWAGCIGYNEFSDRVVKLRPPPFDPGGERSRLTDEWSDIDDTRAATWIAQHEGFVPSSSMIAEAVSVVARFNAFHPVVEYLKGLPKWDGTDRLDHWLADHLHVTLSGADVPRTRGEYVARVGRWFLMGMVARVRQPGVKFDYCLVFEGVQGLLKSTALRTLGGPWFSDTELDLANKDSLSAIRGKWLHEFGEMGSIARSESQRQKSFLSRQFDEFRPVYGRREIRCPRQLVFAGTTNEWQWNKDPTGGRRFWPIHVPDEINIEGLAAIRDQLFAEADARVLAGERFWPTGAEQRELFDPEQLSREAPNTYVEILAAWLNDRTNDLQVFSLADAIQKGLKIDAKGITRDIETRAGMALHKLGCEKFEKRTGLVRHLYRRPVKARDGASAQSAADADFPQELMQ